MSGENVEIVRAVYERWSEGDFRAAVDTLDPHVLLVVRPEFPEAGTYLGNEAVAAYTRSSLLETDRHLTMKAEEIIAAGDSVLVGVRQRVSEGPAALRRRCVSSRCGPFAAAR